MRRSLVIATLLSLAASPVWADRPVDIMHPVVLDKAQVPQLVNSHVLYLNRCKSGCKVTSGFTDSKTDHSDIGAGTLSAFSYGDTTWNSVVACIKGVMAPFNITVTETDPGTADHFEVMIAGSPGQLGLSNGVGGIADYPCGAIGQCNQYYPNALVFDFAQVWGGNVTAICGTAAQEIAHAWTLDHTTNASDPMTYKNYSGTLSFKDAMPCGSDCDYACPGGTGTCNVFGITCTGSGTTGTHACMNTAIATQDEIKIIKAIFGPAGAMPPALSVTPATGSAQQAGFAVDVTCTSNDGILEVDLAIDGTPKFALTATPYHFTTPADLKDGPHKVTVTCATKNLAVSTADVNVIIGQACSTDATCPTNFICFDGACLAGPMAPGGVGATCGGNGDCVSGQCASDGTNSYCVIPCDLAIKNCPDGFGCLEAGAAGVCWPGYDDGGGGGCCDSGGSSAPGSILLGLGFAAALVTRRNRR